MPYAEHLQQDLRERPGNSNWHAYLHDIRGVDTIEDERNTTMIFEVVSCSSPVESATSLILPEVVTSVLDTIDIKSLRTVWECSVAPRLTSFDDLFIR